MGFLERSVTVNFSNQTSRTLTKADQHIENDGDYSYTLPPGTIQPWQTVQWKNAESDFVNTTGSVDYKFSRVDNGQDGHIHVGWNDPVSSGNTYNVSCDPSPLYGIWYTGGGGTSATINVTFVERDLSLAYGSMQTTIYHPNGKNYFLCSSGATDVIGTPMNDSPLTGPDDVRAWGFVDVATGRGTTFPPPYGSIVKIRSGATGAWLVAFSSDNNKIGLLAPNYADYPDSHWEVGPPDLDGGYLFKNVYRSSMLLTCEEGRIYLREGRFHYDYENTSVWGIRR